MEEHTMNHLAINGKAGKAIATGDGTGCERGEGGRFLPGGAGGPGRPKAPKTVQLRSELLAATTEHDIREVWATLLSMAKGGDLAAIREVLDRAIGRAVPTVGYEPNTEGEVVIRLAFDDAH